MPGDVPAAAALGRQFEREAPSLARLTALCAGAVADGPVSPRARPVPTLCVLLQEYAAVRQEGGVGPEAALS